jgi:hypothetical protein
MMKKKRPKAVSISAWLFLIMGFVGLVLLTPIVWKISSPQARELLKVRFEAKYTSLTFNPWYFIFLALVFIFSMFSLMLGNALLKLKEWARRWAIYISCINIFFYLLLCYFIKRFNITMVIWVLIFAVIIYSLTRFWVAEQFE